MTGPASAGADAAPKVEAGPKAPATAPAPAEGAGAAGTTAAKPPAGGSLGERVAKKSAVGGAEDAAEKDADATAERITRMAEPASAGATPAATTPAAPSAGAMPQQPAAGTASGAGTRPSQEPAVAPEPVRRQVVPGGQASPAQAEAPKAPVPAPTAPARGEAPKAEEPPKPAEEPPAPEGEQPARGTPEVSEKTQAYLDASRGQGVPLPEKVRQYFETRFSCDLSHVRIHDDSGADDAARSIQALAFTRGSDIYFRTSAYDPEGEAGRKLIAHELAHVVQQRPGINRRGVSGDVIRPAKDDKKAAKGTATKFEIPTDLDKADKDAPKGTIDTDAKTLSLDEVYVPKFKLKDHAGPLTMSKEERTGEYRKTWADAASPNLQKALKKKIKGDQAAFFEFGAGSKALLFVGKGEDIASALTTLPYDKKGTANKYQIDHRKEAQFQGAAETSDNLWLLDASLNQSSGPAINNAIRGDIKKFLALAKPKLAKPPAEGHVTGAKTWTVTFQTVKAGPNPRVKSKAKAFTETFSADKHAWELKELAEDEAVTPLKSMSKENRKKATGSDQMLAIFTRRGGGSLRQVPYKGTEIDVSKWWGPGYKVKKGTYDPSGGKPEVGEFLISFFEEGKASKMVPSRKKFPFPIMRLEGVEYGGYVDTTAIGKARDDFKANFASPITFPDIDFDFVTGIAARGVIPKPEIKLLENVQIAVVLKGDEVGIEATITGDEMKLPGPFKISGGSITLSATTGGLGVDGRIDFEIEKLAKGFIAASASAKHGSTDFSLEGELDFDTKMFTEAKLGLSYKDKKWGVKGKLAVGEGKIKGIKSASAQVAVEDETVTADGEFVSSIKGIDKGKVSFRYDPKTGMEIAGEIELGKGIPGVKGGKLDATVKQNTAGDWSLAGGIVIQPDVPGLSGDVKGRYEDGAFLVEANLGYEKGMAKGSVLIGVTNQAVGPEGKPAGPPTDHLLVYGAGEVTLKIAPWLQGTVGLQLKPNGEIEVKGKVALPDHLDVFPEKRVEKRVFSIGIDIPIIGFSVLGHRVGIFATIKGGLDVFAGFGPGQLRNLSLEVTYNPAHEEQTTVIGTAAFYVPAGAGLRLSVSGGLGAGIPIVSAEAGLTVYGEIGVQGAAEADAKVEWSPARGVVLDAKGSLSVEPKFKFGIEAYVDVSVDLLFTTKELYHNKWSLASFEYGSNMRFGLVFPIHYEEGKPFDVSFDQVQWTYPTIDPMDLLSGLVKQLI